MTCHSGGSRSFRRSRLEAALSESPPPERIFNAPAASILVAASIPALFIVQETLPHGWQGLAFRPNALAYGDWWPGLLTSMFLHANWMHVAMNAAGALAFGPPVARLSGPGVWGGAAFLLFYIACGLAATLGYGLLHLDSDAFLVGASGAVFGLTGAAIRLLGRRGGRPRSMTDRRVLTTAAALMILNAAVGLLGFAPGMGQVNIAWEAHAFGFVFGFLAVGPWARLFSSRRLAFDSSADLRDPPA